MHTIRSRPPLSSSFNQPSCLFDNTCERNPLLISSPLSPKCNCSCCCCCCYAANISMHDRLVSENPSFLCKGLSQSTLIQWSLCKRLIFHGGIRQSYGNTYGFLSFDDLDESYCYEKLRSFKKKRQFLSNVNDDCVNDGEVMLSLLTDEVDLEYSDVKNRKKIDFEVIKMKSLEKSKNLEWRKEDSFGGLDGNKDCEVKSDGYYVGQTSSSSFKNDLGKDCIDEVVKMKSLKKSKNLDLRRQDSFGGLEGNQDIEVKSDGYYVGQTSSSSYKNDLGKDCIDEVVKMKSLKKSKNLDLKREDSFGGLEGNQDFEVKSDGYYVGQTSSSSYKNDLGKDYKGCVDKVLGTIEKLQDPVQVLEGLLRKDSVNGCYGDSLGVSQDWRKKSEKKLNKELSQHKSNISVNIEPSKQHSHEMYIITDEPGSRMKYKQFIEMSDNDKSVIESTSITENKLKVIPKVSKLPDIHLRVTSSLPESRIKSFKERSTEVNAMVTKPTSIQDNKDGGSRHSSQGSGPKGPSDEMWHVTDASTQEPSERDNTYGSSENGEPVKTSGKSLWTIIGDVVRLHWKSSRSGSHTTSSETWFSSHEPDDPNDENVRKRIIKGLDSPLLEGPSRNTSLPMIKESTFSLKRSPEIKKMVKTGPDHLTELKRRKLVHKDEIFEDNFDKWEEIYNLEKNQLKEDEMFMREALLEAKKAADVWEVPVGAVLVKDGKIVARGYNMVEELQDSTAHAEMICIRKASTNISSWRLSDSTLYVTLEPCPMCAGAILQARIHTVVWGAPNKLLGADGSWISLFCDGDGGSSSMMTAITPAPAPVHPFHPNMAVRRRVLAAECGEVMQHFFQLRRKKKAEPQPPNPPSSISVSHHHQHHDSNFLSKIHHAFNAIFCL